MRQYKILYKRTGMPNFKSLEPGTTSNLADRPQVKAAIDLMRDNPCVEGMAVRLDDELFNIVAFEQPAEAPLAFKFPDAIELVTEGIVINPAVEEFLNPTLGEPHEE